MEENIKFKTIQFKAGTYIFIEDQTNSSEFYIVKQGVLVEENPLNSLTKENDQLIKTGDFFGVLDCMSQRPRVSSIRAIENSTLIVIRFDQFESLISQMAPVAMKIIRYFSNRLRKYNTTLAQLTSDTTYHTDSEQLIKLGEYYHKHNLLDLAGYAYSRFLETHPNHIQEDVISDNLKMINFDPIKIKPQRKGIQQTYTAGMPIFLEYEAGSDIYIILEGCVKITKFIENKEVLLGMLKEKDIFGEMSILDNSPRSASAIAATNVTVLRINKENFELYIHTHPEIAKRIIQLLSDRIWLIYKRLSNQLINDPITKIYDALQTLLQKNRVPLQKGLAYSFDMSPEDIVQFIGLDTIAGQKIINQIIANDPVLKVVNNKLMSTDVYSIRSASISSISNKHKSRSASPSNNAIL